MTSKNWETRRRNGWKPSTASRVKMSESALKRWGKPIDRFWAQVSKGIGKRCWEWTGAKDDDGYGQIVVKQVSIKSHRFSWTLHYGEIPEGMLVCHHCDNPGCVKPGHLFLGNVIDNSRDCVAKGRHAHGERSGPAKLKTDQVVEIINWKVGCGETIRKLAERMWVCVGAIEYIRYRNGWRHIPRGLS